MADRSEAEILLEALHEAGVLTDEQYAAALRLLREKVAAMWATGHPA